MTRAEAARLRELILPETPRYSPLALGAAPEAAPTTFFDQPAAAFDPRDTVPGQGDSAFDAETPIGSVDVFEELARLPEPAPLHVEAHSDDLLAPPPEPVALPVNASVSEGGSFAEWQSFRSALPTPVEPTLVEPANGSTASSASTEALTAPGASDAPPIDIAARTASEWGTGWSTAPSDTAPSDTASASVGSDTADVEELASRVPSPWAPEPQSWESNELAGSEPTTADDPFGFGPGDGTAWGAPAALEIIEYIDEYVEPQADEVAMPTDATSEWALEPNSPATVVDRSWGDTTEDATPTNAWDASDGHNGWDRRPDPEATSTGFYVDWGTADEAAQADDAVDSPLETLDAPVASVSTDPWLPAEPSFDAWEPVETPLQAWTTPNEEPSDAWTPTDEPSDPWIATDPHLDLSEPPEAPADDPIDAPFETWSPADEPSETWTPGNHPAEELPSPSFLPDPADDGFAPISWRPLSDSASPEEIAVVTASILETIAAAEPVSSFDATADLAPVAEPPVRVEPVIETFVSAGSEWELGNAVPLVEVRSQGGLVMRRADERWALADITTTPNFALEVDVDFRTGPGFGVLFQASTDADAHMSGFSFDVDPIHEGGSYLVRQWQADRELWNPIARAAAADPAAMHGILALRIVVVDDCLSASVNGVEVLNVASLDAACHERNRGGPRFPRRHPGVVLVGSRHRHAARRPTLNIGR